MGRDTREKRDLHALNADGMVLCNPRDREAAHRAEMEGIAIDDHAVVTCRKCLDLLYNLRREQEERCRPWRPVPNPIWTELSMGQQTAALQLWTVRDTFAADADGALSRVKAAGFSAVEFAPLPPGLEPARLAESLARHGLAVVSIHGDLPTPETIGHWAQFARACRCSKLIWHG